MGLKMENVNVKYVPNVKFRYRATDDDVCVIGNDPSVEQWKDVWTEDMFKGKRILVFSLPGAFTPTCSSKQLPRYEEMYDELKGNTIDEVYCISVNDAFVMRKWFADQGIEKVKYIPDGNGEFTRKMGMLVDKSNLGFGMRSWRYAMVVDDMRIIYFNAEPNLQDNAEEDPYINSHPEEVIMYLRGCFNIDYDR